MDGGSYTTLELGGLFGLGNWKRPRPKAIRK